MNSPMLAPVMALVLWSFVMWAWLYATRIPAIVKQKIVFDQTKPASEFHKQLPASVRWKADNYNNLMEQPTLFYAAAFTLALTNADYGLNVQLAWAYVVVRVVHSLVQATVNVIPWRFGVFMVASLILLALSIRAAMTVFSL